MRRAVAVVTTFLLAGMLLGVIQLSSDSILAGEDEVTKCGSDADLVEGDWQYSALYPDGIELSPGVGAGWAVWSFSIDPTPRTDHLSVTAHTSDESSLGDGADLYLYNVLTGVYDHITHLNKGADIVSTTGVTPQSYIGWDGSVKVYVFADELDDTHVDYVRLDWTFDDSPPVNPYWATSEPGVDCYTSDNVIQVQWFGAIDDDNSVGGYSILWSNETVDLPDDAVDTILPSTISPWLADGTWYLHVRTVDSVGNWNDTSFAIGPFLVDCCAPALVILTPADESTSDSNNVTVSWQGDDGGSGIVRYEISVDGSPWRDLGNCTNCVLTDLTSSYHTVWVRAHDAAGNSVTKVVDFAVHGDPEGTEELAFWLVLLISVIIIAVVIITAATLAKAKRQFDDDELE